MLGAAAAPERRRPRRLTRRQSQRPWLSRRVRPHASSNENSESRLSRCTRRASHGRGSSLTLGKAMFSFFKKPEPLNEASMNFDAENVAPFLDRVSPLVESGFGPTEKKKVLDLLASLKIDDERELSFSIRYSGKASTLKVRIFLDDVGAPDLYFFACPPLSIAIQAEMEKFADDLGI